MKYLLALTVLFLTAISFSYSNGIWTYAEDIRAGVFGLNENNPSGSNYTFNDRVYFNANIFARSNLTAENTLFTNRIVGIENSTYRIDLRGGRISRFSGVVAEAFFSPESNNFFLVPNNTSVLRNINVTGVLVYRGENIEDVFVLEGQANSITSTMIENGAIRLNHLDSSVENYFDSRFVLEGQLNSISRDMIENNAITINEIDTSSLDNRYLRRDGGNIMNNNLNMGGNRITNVAPPVSNNDVATKEYVDIVSSSNPLNSCNLCYEMRRNTGGVGWQCISLDGTSNSGDWSAFSVNRMDNECRPGGCGIRMEIRC